MRIISKFHDYYDTVMKTGMDTEVIYQREVQEIEISSRDKDNYPALRSTSFQGNKSTRVEISYLYLGYCGKIYPAVQVSVTPWLAHVAEEYCFFNAEDAISEISKYVDLKEKHRYKFLRDRSYFDERVQEDYLRFFNQEPSKELLKKFSDYNVPLFVYQKNPEPGRNHEYQLLLNPSLKDLKFMKVKEPYSAFQDISSFVSGVLNQPVNKMVVLNDQMKIAKHGFDKWSFRKHKDQK